MNQSGRANFRLTHEVKCDGPGPMEGEEATEQPAERGRREEDEASEDSDAAPEDISLSRGREEALRSRRAASMEAKR